MVEAGPSNPEPSVKSQIEQSTREVLKLLPAVIVAFNSLPDPIVCRPTNDCLWSKPNTRLLYSVRFNPNC
jgi:hypothetical protein